MNEDAEERNRLKVLRHGRMYSTSNFRSAAYETYVQRMLAASFQVGVSDIDLAGPVATLYGERGTVSARLTVDTTEVVSGIQRMVDEVTAFRKGLDIMLRGFKTDELVVRQDAWDMLSSAVNTSAYTGSDLAYKIDRRPIVPRSSRKSRKRRKARLQRLARRATRKHRKG